MITSLSLAMLWEAGHALSSFVHIRIKVCRVKMPLGGQESLHLCSLSPLPQNEQQDIKGWVCIINNNIL